MKEKITYLGMFGMPLAIFVFVVSYYNIKTNPTIIDWIYFFISIICIFVEWIKIKTKLLNIDGGRKNE